MDVQQVRDKLSNMSWTFGDQDPRAAEELKARIESRARRQGLIYYSDLVEGVVFQIPTVNSGRPYVIDTTAWEGLDRRLLGDFLGYLSAESFVAHEFMISALVVGKVSSEPSQHFYDWMEELGVLPNVKEDTVLAFWADQVRRALAHYRMN